MNDPIRVLCWLIPAIMVLAASGCSTENDETDTERQQRINLQLSEQEIRDTDGNLLLNIDQIPSGVYVDEETEFGASGAFSDASASPTGGWLAITTMGVSHGGGWLEEMESGDIFPAAFQYGGTVDIGSWSSDGRYVVFINESPSGSRTLSIADTESRAETVTENAQNVRIPNHDEMEPDQLNYGNASWQNGRLFFTVDGQRWSFDTETGNVESEG